MGSPEFAIPILRAVVERYAVVGVVTQPDRPAGRGRLLTSPPVKLLAQEYDLPVIQPIKINQPEAIEQLQAWDPKLIVVAAFGQILRQDVLNLPLYGCINVHASLLPRWRGAAPIQAAILNGEDHTGVTIMRMDIGVDTGPTLGQRAAPILPEDTTTSLSERLANLGAELLIDTLPGYLSGDIQPYPQEDSLATFAPMLKKEDGELDFNRSAAELAHRVRALNPWPGAYTIWQNQSLKIHRVSAVSTNVGEGISTPGRHVVYQGLPAICTTQGLLVLDELQPAGKKPMSGKVFLQGARNWA